MTVKLTKLQDLRQHLYTTYSDILGSISDFQLQEVSQQFQLLCKAVQGGDLQALKDTIVDQTKENELKVPHDSFAYRNCASKAPQNT